MSAMLDLLDKEIRKLEASLTSAQNKPNASEEEISNIQIKLDLKRRIREIVEDSEMLVRTSEECDDEGDEILLGTSEFYTIILDEEEIEKIAKGEEVELETTVKEENTFKDVSFFIKKKGSDI